MLPLKIAAPRWFDGTALVVGSMVPDLVFVTHGTGWYIDAHTVGPQFWLCLPLTIALVGIIKIVIAAPLGAHLPDTAPWHLRDYGRLAARPLPTRPTGWLRLIASALIGSFSHLLFDSFTHGFGFAVQHFDVLQAQAFELPTALTGRAVFVHDLLQVGGTVIGGAVTIWCLFVIGRRRLITDWYPIENPLEPTPTSRPRLTIGTVGGLIAGLVTAALSAHIGGAQDLIIRVAALTFLGLVVGCIIARPVMATTDRSAAVVVDPQSLVNPSQITAPARP